MFTMKSITLLLVLGETCGSRHYLPLITIVSGLGHSESATPYFGQYVGPFTDKVSTVSGNVYAVDKSSIIVTNFTHDGSDPGELYVMTHDIIF